MVVEDTGQPIEGTKFFKRIEWTVEVAWEPGNSWRKCHKKAKNVLARFDSNLPSCRNAYKQISELSVGGISVQMRSGAHRSAAERLIRSESLD
jgi:hypothetical protein